MIEKLIAVLLTLSANPDRAPTIATAIHQASGGNPRLAALIVTTGHFESRFQDRIQAGECKRWECDSYVTRSGEVRFRARSFFQLQRPAAASWDEWASTTGLEPENVTLAAAVAGRLLSRGLRGCGTLDGAFGVYAGVGCRWVGAPRRVAMARRIESRLSG